MNNESNAIELQHVTKNYSTFTLKDISLSLPSGCIMGLIGENGAGKSTTIQLIMNTLKREAGDIFVLGKNNQSKEFRQVKEDIGIVLDEANFPEVLNLKNVNHMMKHTYKNWQEDLFFQYARQFELEEKKLFKEYSRGMKMKLAIATALSHQPKLLILDEATSGLDPIIRDEVLELFNDFTREEDHSVLISSHIISDLEKICDYIAFLHQGELLFCEEKDRLLEEYGILHTNDKSIADIPAEAVSGKREGKYSTELLVKRALISPAFDVEPASIEDIILFMVKNRRY